MAPLLNEAHDSREIADISEGPDDITATWNGIMPAQQPSHNLEVEHQLNCTLDKLMSGRQNGCRMAVTGSSGCFIYDTSQLQPSRIILAMTLFFCCMCRVWRAASMTTSLYPMTIAIFLDRRLSLSHCRFFPLGMSYLTDRCLTLADE